jgi:hypothetical protein
MDDKNKYSNITLEEVKKNPTGYTKHDVYKTRVRNIDISKYDIHDRVNFAVERSFLKVTKEAKVISLQLTVGIQISKVVKYFEVLMSRMFMCRRATSFLDYKFKLIINERKLL